MTAPVLASAGYQLDVDGYALLEHETGVGRVDTLAVESSFGNPVPVVEAMVSLMRDGDLTRTTRDGNRVVTFRHRVTAPTPRMLDEAGEALVAAVMSGRQLRWQKPGGAESDCYDVVRVVTERLFDDQWDVAERQKKRIYRVSYECLPYVRSGDPVTVNWTGGYAELSVLKADWTTAGTSAGTGISSTGTATVSKTITASEYVWVKVTGDSFDSGTVVYHVTNVKVNGVSVPDARVMKVAAAPTAHFYTIPTEGLRGQSVLLEFAIVKASGGSSITLAEVWTVRYPNAAADPATTAPPGISVLDVVGSARAPIALLSFTAPTGGAWLLTAPDPNAALRDRGAIENLYEKWTVGGGDPVYLPGDYVRVTARSQPQPPVLNPDGIWPQYATGADQLAYPSAPGTAVSFFPAGAVSVISASPDLPTGFHPEAIVHEEHVLHPGECGFAVIAAATGLPITATITYYPRRRH